MSVLADIQKRIKAPKDKENKFGGYKYRNAESILAAFKECQPDGVALLMSDQISIIGEQLFLTATATLMHDGAIIAQSNGVAMHALSKKGMDDAQISGACSSYARKYALCGLFAIDDSADDPDSKDNRHVEEKKPSAPKPANAEPKTADDVAEALRKAQTMDDLVRLWNGSQHILKNASDAALARAEKAKDDRKAELSA